MIEDSRDIQREGFAKKQPHEETLAKLFANNGLLDRVGSAFVWVSYKSKNGTRYGSAKYVHKDCIEGREYELSQSALCPWTIHLLFTDELFDPKVNYRERMRSLTCFEKST